MKIKRTIALLGPALLAAAWLVAPAPASAGGNLEAYDITGSKPVPGAPPGFVVAKTVPMLWDSRCIPVAVRSNSTFDPIPNPLGPPVITLAQAETAINRSFASWNNIHTSFFRFDLVGRVANPGLPGFDTVNEATFNVPPGVGFIGLSVPTFLIADSNLTPGDDIDGDGDSDVAPGIGSCADADGDGDIEFPPGRYKAGTILDNDVLFASGDLRFTVNDADIDTNFGSVDLEGVAVHEFGHAHGLSHALGNQISSSDGTGATMFPFIDTGDPTAELNQRSLDSDDIAFSSFFYPEGSAGSGPAALQLGDIPFKLIYGIVEGEATHGASSLPLAGGSVFANNVLTGRQQATAISGTTQLAFQLSTGSLFFVDPTFDIIDGRYRIPLPLGIYNVGIEAIDGGPVSIFSINNTAQIGGFWGLQNFDEEFWTLGDAASESRPGLSLPVAAVPSVTTPNVDVTTNVTNKAANFGGLDSVGFTGVPAGFWYAVRIPAAQVTALSPSTIHTGLFNTFVANASVVPVFARAQLTTGSVNPGTGVATINTATPLREQAPFVGQDGDFAPLYFSNPTALTSQIMTGISGGTITDLFLVLQLPTTLPFPGVSGFPPFIGLDLGPSSGTSYFSTTGTTFSPTSFNFMFALGTTP